MECRNNYYKMSLILKIYKMFQNKKMCKAKSHLTLQIIIHVIKPYVLLLLDGQLIIGFTKIIQDIFHLWCIGLVACRQPLNPQACVKRVVAEFQLQRTLEAM